jgi:hypothetical protein
MSAVDPSLSVMIPSETLQKRTKKRLSTYSVSKIADTGFGSGSEASNALRQSMKGEEALTTTKDLVALTGDGGDSEARVTTALELNRNLERKQGSEEQHEIKTIEEPQSSASTLPEDENMAKNLKETSEGYNMPVVEHPMTPLKQEMAPEALEADINIWETAQSHPSPPELSSRVQKLKKRPHFDGTYSRVYCGEYNGQKVRKLITSLLQVHVLKKN